MTGYLDFKFDPDGPGVVDAFDELTFWSSLFGQLLFRHLRLVPGLTALDVGCGTGFPLFELADRLGPSGRVHGIDLWRSAVVRARRKAQVRGNANLRIIHGDASRLPYAGGTFDLIVSNVGINNFRDPGRVMAECRRVIKSGGRLVLTTNLVGHMREFYAAYEQTLLDLGHERAVERLREQEGHRATLEGLRNLFIRAGFRVTACHTETHELHYADGTALLNAYLTRLGFLDGWKEVLGASEPVSEVFAELEARLNRTARQHGEGLCLSVPAAFIEGCPTG